MERMSCLVALLGHVLCFVIWIVLGAVLFILFEVDNFMVSLAWLAVWIISSSIASIIVLYFLYIIEDYFSQKMEERSKEK